MQASSGLLVLFPLRLGLSCTLDPRYYNLVKAALRAPWSVGVAGGRPNRAFYFCAYQMDDLFYLDPHCVRPALTGLPQAINSLELHTDTVRSLPIRDIDSSVLLGFVLRDVDEVDEFTVWLEMFKDIFTIIK